MIERDDLRAAVAAGVVTEAQAARLTAMSEERRGIRAIMGPSDEPFELFRGLNEIFIVVGLTILYFGWLAVTGLTIFNNLGAAPVSVVGLSIVALFAIVAAAQYFTIIRRMV
ncbi:MAG: hypothetical protein KJO67_02450, partial [Silicimonas sp.]|nr:hypothetical protein [Silicimonas sp.]